MPPAGSAGISVTVEPDSEDGKDDPPPDSPNFQITSIDAPDAVEASSQFTVNATIRNDGNQMGTQTVSFNSGSQIKTGKLEAGQVAIVPFSTTAGPFPGNTVKHTMATDNDTSVELKIVE